MVGGGWAGGTPPDEGVALGFAALGFPEDFAPPENRNDMVAHTFYTFLKHWFVDCISQGCGNFYFSVKEHKNMLSN